MQPRDLNIYAQHCSTNNARTCRCQAVGSSWYWRTPMHLHAGRLTKFSITGETRRADHADAARLAVSLAR